MPQQCPVFAGGRDGQGSLVSYLGTQTRATQKLEHPCPLHIQGPHSDWEDSEGLPVTLPNSTRASSPTAFSKGKAELSRFQLR